MIRTRIAPSDVAPPTPFLAALASNGRTHASSLTRYCETINEHPGFTTLGISILYFAVTLALSSIKLIWLNEFITLYISKLGNLHSILNALSRGADPNPPLTYLLVIGSRKLFEGSLALRLPGILASWAVLVALYAFLRRRVPVVYAAAGALFFIATLQKLIVQGRPARLLPIFTDTKDIQGFTPLAHGPVWFFAEGSFPDLPPVDARVTLSEASPPEIHEIK